MPAAVSWGLTGTGTWRDSIPTYPGGTPPPPVGDFCRAGGPTGVVSLLRFRSRRSRLPAIQSSVRRTILIRSSPGSSLRLRLASDHSGAAPRTLLDRVSWDWNSAVQRNDRWGPNSGLQPLAIATPAYPELTQRMGDWLHLFKFLK